MSAHDTHGVVAGLLVPGLPHPLLTPEANPGYGRLRTAFDAARERIAELKPDLLLIYSTMWTSVIGHQLQARPEPEWVHVDELFHGLGSIPYRFRMDAGFAEAWRDAAEARGLQARTVDYHGFPIDTGSVVALKLLNPDNALPAVIVSSNVYSDRAETLVLGKACADVIEAQGRRAVAVVVSTLSNRLFTDWLDPAEDRIHSPKDDEWNRKILEFLAAGRLEDVAQLSREIHRQIRVKKVVNFKSMWWLSATMGQHNRYAGEVLAYEALHGTGGAVVLLEPTPAGVGDKEYDEDDVDVYRGDRQVLTGPDGAPVASARVAPSATVQSATKASPKPRQAREIRTSAAPDPVGAYPHARRVGELIFVSGMGPRQPGTDAIPGGPIRDGHGQPLDYDAAAQTRAVIANIAAVLESVGSSLDRVFDVTCFLVNMDRDFEAYNAVYAEHFASIQAARTTVEVRALPTPIAVEMKVVALAAPAGE